MITLFFSNAYLVQCSSACSPTHAPRREKTGLRDFRPVLTRRRGLDAHHDNMPV